MKFLCFFILFFIQVVNAEDMSSFQHPVQSPDGKLIAFIKSTYKKIPNGCFTSSDGNSDIAIDPVTGLTIDPDQNRNTNRAQQIWIYHTKTKKENLLVHDNFSCQHPTKQILDPEALQFSPDSKKLYFIATGWVTSGALHVVNVDGSNEHFLIPANEYRIVQKGQYQGYIIAMQHRYFIGGGSYNWYWLFSPTGKKISPLGKEITNDQKQYLES